MSFPVYTSTERDPAARGRELGAAGRSGIETALAGYAELFRAFGVIETKARVWGESAVAEIAAWAPELAAELTGLAEGAAVELWQVGALNARTEVLAAARATGLMECSTAVFLPGAGQPPRTIQTWDWKESLRDVPVAWTYRPRVGVEVHAFAEFGMLGKVGVNSAGLGVHFNILQHASDDDAIGVPVHVVARRILDHASDLDEATEIARSARLSASTVLTVVGFDGSRGGVRGLELCPGGVGVVEADETGLYLHTNHFLDPVLASGERRSIERPDSIDRLKRMRAQPEGLTSADLMQRVRAMSSHYEDGAPLCCHPLPEDPFELRSETLATISIDLAERRLALHPGGPCRVSAETWQFV